MYDNDVNLTFRAIVSQYNFGGSVSRSFVDVAAYTRSWLGFTAWARCCSARLVACLGMARVSLMSAFAWLPASQGQGLCAHKESQSFGFPLAATLTKTVGIYLVASLASNLERTEIHPPFIFWGFCSTPGGLKTSAAFLRPLQ